MRILIAEGERNLANGLRFNLEKRSHEVTCVPTAEDALSEFALHDILVLDSTLPNASSQEVFQRVRTYREDFPILLMFASEDELWDNQVAEDLHTVQLRKPFSLKGFLQHIDTLLYSGVDR